MIGEGLMLFRYIRGAPHINNYRPISLTSIVCKQMEKLVASYIQNFWRTKKRLSDSQHGFRKSFCVTPK